MYKYDETVRLHSPQVLLGYERTRQMASAVAGKDVVDSGRGKDATYVNLYMTIEPPLKVISAPDVGNAPFQPNERVGAGAGQGEAGL